MTLNVETHAVNPVDIHKARASELFSVPVEDVTGKQRELAKVYYHGKNYGMTRKAFNALLCREGMTPISND